MTDLGGVWRTVGGRRIFIKDGEDLSTAMKKSGKFKSIKKAYEDYKANYDYEKEMPEGARFNKMLEENKVRTFADDIKEKETLEYKTMMKYVDNGRNTDFKDYIQLDNNTIIARDKRNTYSVIEKDIFVVDGEPIPKNNKYMKTNSSVLKDLLEIKDDKFKKIGKK